MSVILGPIETESLIGRDRGAMGRKCSGVLQSFVRSFLQTFVRRFFHEAVPVWYGGLTVLICTVQKQCDCFSQTALFCSLAGSGTPSRDLELRGLLRRLQSSFKLLWTLLGALLRSLKIFPRPSIGAVKRAGP